MNVMTAGQQMFVIFLLMMVGFLCQRKKLVDASGSACLSRLVVNVFNPAMIFSSVLGNAAVRTEDSLVMLFAVSAGIFIFLILSAGILTRFTKSTAAEKKIQHLMYVFGNVGFVGIPVVKALLGSEKLIYVAVFILEYNLLLYSYGTFLLQKKEDSRLSLKSLFSRETLTSLKPCINMGTFACAATFIVFLSGIQIPGPLSDSLMYLANATTPVSLLVIGVSLGTQEHITSLFTSGRRYLFCFWKLVAVPLIGALLLKLLPVSESLCQTYLILMAMPVGNINLMLVQQNGMDGTECARTIILTTLLSVISIPLVVWVYTSFM